MVPQPSNEPISYNLPATRYPFTLRVMPRTQLKLSLHTIKIITLLNYLQCKEHRHDQPLSARHYDLSPAAQSRRTSCSAVYCWHNSCTHCALFSLEIKSFSTISVFVKIKFYSKYLHFWNLLTLFGKKIRFFLWIKKRLKYFFLNRDNYKVQPCQDLMHFIKQKKIRKYSHYHKLNIHIPYRHDLYSLNKLLRSL